MNLLRPLLIALIPLAANAQQQPAPSAAAQFSGKLAELLTDTMTERDVARTQLAACQAAAKPPQPPPTPSPEKQQP